MKKTENILRNYIQKKKCTLLAIGPMSKNIVDSTVELSNTYEIPLMLIASRRQIDSQDHGSGYVNNWSTKEFSNYVKKKDKKNNIILCRDHGGPWQNNIENNLNINDAMKSAKKSYKSDIINDFQIIHIDPSINKNKTQSVNSILEKIFELYEFCYEISKKYKKKILFEIGTEEQVSGLSTLEDIKYWISRVINFCNQNKIPQPFFIVTQTGTKVLELENVGAFDSDIRVKDQLPIEIQIPKIIEFAEKNNFFIKEHNADYLSDDALKWHPRLSIHAANVAPEFGTTETISLIELMNRCNMKNEKEHFLEIAYNSNKWKKWMIKDSYSNDYKKSIICGHYVFADDKVVELKNKLNNELKFKNIDMNNYLKDSIKKAIKRYLYPFKII